MMAHADVQEAAKTAAERAIDAGNALIEAKRLCNHGEWLPWLRENCALAERTAQLYMKVAKSGLGSATIADLGLNAAAQAVVLRMADPFDGDSEEAVREWSLFLLWGVKWGKPGEAAEAYCHWLRRNGWETPSQWLGMDGDEFRARLGMAASPSSAKTAWAAFLAANLKRGREDIAAEIEKAVADRPEHESSGPKRGRKRRRAPSAVAA